MLRDLGTVTQRWSRDGADDGLPIPEARAWHRRIVPAHIADSQALDRWLRARFGWGVGLVVAGVGVWRWTASDFAGRPLFVVMCGALFLLLACGLRVVGSIAAMRMRSGFMVLPSLDFSPSSEEVKSFVHRVAGLRKPDPLGWFSRAGCQFDVILESSGDGRMAVVYEVPDWAKSSVERGYPGVEYRRVFGG